MVHASIRPNIPASLQKRIKALPTRTSGMGVSIVEGFAIFIDTHRDQPHIGTFTEDIHRGVCRPIPVNYVVGDDWLQNPEDGKFIQRHDKHMFIEPEAWGQLLVNVMMTTGKDPRDDDGTVPTSFLRDARKKIYLLRSFRQMVIANEKRT